MRVTCGRRGPRLQPQTGLFGLRRGPLRPRLIAVGVALCLDFRQRTFVVHRSDTLTRSATVLMLDMSRSMPLRGYFYAAKKVALALDSLIRRAYPRDTLHIIGFSDLAREIKPAALPHLSVNEYVYGTNMQHGLMLARRLLARDPGENKQIIIVSDGEPTAHIENGRPVFFYPPLPETFQKTLLEVKRCTRENIVINTFMLEFESSSGAVRESDDAAESRARVFYQSRSAWGLRARRLCEFEARGGVKQWSSGAIWGTFALTAI